MRSLHPQARPRPKGQTLPWLAIGIAAVVLLVATLARYRSRSTADRPRTGAVYLGDERAAVDGPDRATGSRVGAGRAGRSAKADGSARVIASDPKTFSYAAASRIFAIRRAGTAGPGAEAEEAQGLVASDDVLVRAFGRPDGNWIYHRVHGWMRFDGTRWVPVVAEDLPASLLAEYPELAPRPGSARADLRTPAVAPRGGSTGTDGAPLLPPWLDKGGESAPEEGS